MLRSLANGCPRSPLGVHSLARAEWSLDAAGIIIAARGHLVAGS